MIQSSPIDSPTTYLVFDVETCGIPDDWDSPASDTANWPRLVQIAWVLLDAQNREVRGHGTSIVKPDGFTIPPEAQKVHGISTRTARREGLPLKLVLKHFERALWQTDYLVGHNVNFDIKVTAAEYIRHGRRDPLASKSSICTMRESTGYCQLPGRHGYKWPTLQELHKNLFENGFEESHNAVKDVKACARCFLELHKRGIIAKT